MLRIITANLNGIRSAASKGFFDWASQQQADFIGVQEIKAQEDVVGASFSDFADLRGVFHYAQKRGYSGVGLYMRHEPDDVIIGLGAPEFDAEGRWVEARYRRDGKNYSVISCYFPSGSSGDERQQAKFRFLDILHGHLRELASERELVLMGDINIAHQQIDLKNWRGNQKNSGFLPEERAWLSELFDSTDLVDVYRRLHPETTAECYTWWSNRGQAYANNVGWRLDYQLASGAIAAQARSAAVYKEQRFSDHAPLSVDYDLW